MHKTALPLVACLLLAAAAGASAQTIYKWKDANGLMHISDTPPPSDVPAKNVVSRPAPSPAVVAHDAPPAASAASGVAPAVRGGDPELQKKKAQADQDKAAAAAANKAAADKKTADARAQNCTAAQAQVRTLQSGMRIATVNANGEREYLDDAAIAAQTRQAQQAATQNCGAP